MKFTSRESLIGQQFLIMNPEPLLEVLLKQQQQELQAGGDAVDDVPGQAKAPEPQVD